jgi:hypothetical protein
MAENDDIADPRRYWTLAAQAFATVQRLTDPDAQLLMRQLAWCYLRLARHAAERRRPNHAHMPNLNFPRLAKAASIQQGR